MALSSCLSVLTALTSRTRVQYLAFKLVRVCGVPEEQPATYAENIVLRRSTVRRQDAQPDVTRLSVNPTHRYPAPHSTAATPASSPVGRESASQRAARAAPRPYPRSTLSVARALGREQKSEVAAAEASVGSSVETFSTYVHVS
jgi:hypothetical protein